MSWTLARRGIIGALALALSLPPLPGCARLGPLGRLGAPFFAKPEFRFENVGVSNVSFTGFTLGFQVRATNPNRFAMTLRNWRYAVSLNKIVFLEGLVDEEAKIQGRDSKTITIPVEVSYRNVSKLLKGTFDSRALAYDFHSDFDLATWMGSGSVPFSAQGELEMPRRLGRGLLEQFLGGRGRDDSGSGVIREEDLRRWKQDFEERMRERSR